MAERYSNNQQKRRPENPKSHRIVWFYSPRERKRKTSIKENNHLNRPTTKFTLQL